LVNPYVILKIVKERELMKVLGFKDREIVGGKWSEAYYDLHDGKFSMCQSGLVVVHADNIWLKDCKLAVQPSGNAKVRETGVKNVHAYVRGHYMDHDIDFPEDYTRYLFQMGYRLAYYNPKKVTSFVDWDTGKELYEASAVVLIDKQIFYR
jgi:hypothetical protein